MAKCFILLSILLNSLSTLAQTTILWGDNNSRTEYRNDAGLRGDASAVSGFFQTNVPVNFPNGATGYWHLLDVRHSNPSNNYAMQFAGSFYDQLLFFRKVNNNPATAWSRILTESEGKVGIKTAVPSDALQIGNFNIPSQNKVLIPGTYNFERVAIGQAGNGNSIIEFVNHTSVTQSYGVRIGTNVDTYGGGLYITAAPIATTYDSLKYKNPPAIFVKASDNTVGIGTNNPAGYKLAVAGNMIAERIKVKAPGAWPDYVFQEDYRLPSLDSVAVYIQKQKHLPGLPSAKTVEEDGLDVGDMNARLLEKVEQLTLYLIKQHDMIEHLKCENEQIKAEISKRKL
jgi:hypothetical protein